MASAAKMRHIWQSLNEEDRKRLLKALRERQRKTALTPDAPAARGPRWFERPICGLPKEGAARLREDAKALEDPARAYHVDKKWISYAKAFRDMKLRVPASFRRDQGSRAMYDRLVRLCHENNLPEEIVVSIVPSLVEYVQTGHMRPMMFVGEKGSGKTTAVRILMEKALEIPLEVVKIPQLSGGRGLTGDNGSYKSADAGCLAKAQLHHGSLLVGYIFDEIDKVPAYGARSNIDDELLSLTDDSVSDIEDEFLAFRLVSLRHCPVFFTGNDLSKVNPILADRCTVIQFPKASATRIKTIMTQYADGKLNNGVYGMIRMDRERLYASIDKLVARNITSLRKHQELVESVIQNAFSVAMTRTDGAMVDVTDLMFEQAEAKIIGSAARKVGF